MALRYILQKGLKILQFNKNKKINVRSLSHCPIDDSIFGLTEEQLKLRQSVFTLVKKELTPYAEEIDTNNNFRNLRSFWKQLGNLGALGITANSKYGGSDGSYLDQILIIEELSRVSGAIGATYGAHSNLCVNQINRNGSDEQKQQYLPKLCTGEHMGALAMTEVDSGSDVLSMKLSAVKSGDYYVLNGSKYWITNGPDADTIVVYARTNPTAKSQYGITAFIVEREFDGFSSGPAIDKMGVRGSNTSELIFDNCKVPAKNVLGKVDQGVYVLMSGLDYERAILAGGTIGLMQGACDVAFEYAHQRKQFNQRIGEFQLIQGKMADMYTTLNASRAYVYGVARSCDAGKRNAKDCAGAILFSAENATKLGSDAIQIMGGSGYVRTCAASRIMRDAKLFEIGAGTSEIRRLVIGRAINKEYS